MAEKSKQKMFIAKCSFDSPYVYATGLAHKPTGIKMRKFQKGEQFRGEIITEKGKPNFILVDGSFVVPPQNVREVITKEISAGTLSGADGSKNTGILSTANMSPKKKARVHYLDLAIAGSAVGFVITHFLEKKSVIPPSIPQYMNKLIGAGVGCALGIYVAYRFANNSNLSSNKK